MDERVKKLKNSPIYAMSLGSKELFHSNFWAWLMRKNPKFINAFFDGLITDVELEKDGKFKIKIKNNEFNVTPEVLVRREEENRDITVHLNGNLYVIENKIKSIPTNEQLNKYSGSDNFSNGVLTGMQEKMPEYITADNWKFLSYGKIAEEIEKIEWPDGDDKVVINMYCDMLRDLYELISEKLSGKNDEWNFSDADELEIIRFDDVYKKLKLDILKNKILEYIGDTGGYCTKDNEFTFMVETEFTNKQPLLSFKFVYNDSHREDTKGVYSFGIQIQGNSIRRYAETKPGKLKNFKGGYDGFFNAFVRCGWLDKDYSKDKDKKLKLKFCDTIEERITKMSPKTDLKKNNKNGPYNAYTDFVYQFYNIDERTQKIGPLADEIKKNLDYVKSLTNEVKEIFCGIIKG